MSLRQGAILAVSAVGVALLLSGCTPPPPSAPTAAPVASVAPTPTSTPPPKYPTCATMAPSSVLAAIDPGLVLQAPGGYGIAPPAESAAPNARAVFMTAVYPPSASTVLAGLQAGYFDCGWSSPGFGLSVAVLPDSSAAFASYTSSTAYDIASFDGLGLGDRSFGGCKNGDGQSCEIETLTGSTWIAAVSSPGAVSAVTAPAVRANLEAIIRSTIAVVNAAGPIVSAQQQPPSRWQSHGDCSAIDTAVRSITGSAGGAAEKRILDYTDAYDPLFRAAVAQSGAFDCVDTESSVTVVPGADVTAPMVYTSDTTEPVTVGLPGVVSARDLCVASGTTACWTEGYIDHALVTVSGDLSAAGRHAELAAIALALAG